MKFFYKVSASLTTRAIKRTEKVLQKTFEKQYLWSYEFFNKYWPLSFERYLLDFKKKYKVKNIQKDSFLYNQLKSQYLGYKVYLTFTDFTYTAYLNCVKDVVNYFNNLKDGDFNGKTFLS